MKISLLLTLLFLAPALLLRAQTPGKEDELDPKNKMESPRESKVQKSNSKASIKIYGAQVIITPEKKIPDERNLKSAPFIIIHPVNEQEAGGKNLAEILSQIRGVQVKSWGAGSNFSTISIRGSESNQVNIYLNGMPLANTSMGTANLSEILLSGVQQIEIYKDNAPLDFQGSAIGGAINIITDKAAEQNYYASAGYGSFHSYFATTSVQGETQDIRGKFLVHGNSTRGDFRYLNNNGTPYFNKRDDYYTKRENNAQQSLEQRGLIHYGYMEEKGWEWKISEDFFARSEGVPGSSSRPLHSAEQSTLQGRFQAAGSYHAFLFRELNLYFTGYSSIRRDNILDPLTEMNLGSPQITRFFRDTGAGLGMVLQLPEQKISLYQHLVHEGYTASLRREADTSSLMVPSENIQRYKIQTALQYEIFLFKKDQMSLSLDPGVRYELAADMDQSPLFSYTGIIQKNVNIFSLKDYGHRFLNPSLGILFRANDKLSFKSNVRETQRLPSFLELFGNQSQILGNPALKPEKALGFDIGFAMVDLAGSLGKKIDQTDSKGPRFFGKSLLEYSFFYRLTEDMLLLTQNSQNTAIYQNFDKTLVYGHELFFSLEIFRYLQFKTNYTFQNSENLSQIPYYHGKKLPYRPAHELNVRLEAFYAFTSFSLSGFVELVWTGQNFRDRVNSAYYYVEQRQIYNLGLSGKYPESALISVNLEIKNLANDQTSDIYGYPQPGRAYYLSGTWSL